MLVANGVWVFYNLVAYMFLCGVCAGDRVYGSTDVELLRSYVYSGIFLNGTHALSDFLIMQMHKNLLNRTTIVPAY